MKSPPCHVTDDHVSVLFERLEATGIVLEGELCVVAVSSLREYTKRTGIAFSLLRGKERWICVTPTEIAS